MNDKLRRSALLATASDPGGGIVESIPNNMIIYTSTDQQIVEPYIDPYTNGFEVNLVSNAYIGGKGQMMFDGDIPHIGRDAFSFCTSLTSIEIPNSVTSIRDGAFSSCSNLTSIKIPYRITEFGDFSIDGCRSLTSIEIPNNVTYIGETAFYDCSSLTSVYVKAITPPECGYWAFYNNASGRKIYVPRASLDTYKTKYGWKDYADAMEPYDFDEISFTIYASYLTTTYYALTNMTWRDWVSSQYNIGGWYIEGSEIKNIEKFFILDVAPDDIIVADSHYMGSTDYADFPE